MGAPPGTAKMSRWGEAKTTACAALPQANPIQLIRRFARKPRNKTSSASPAFTKARTSTTEMDEIEGTHPREIPSGCALCQRDGLERRREIKKQRQRGRHDHEERRPRHAPPSGSVKAKPAEEAPHRAVAYRIVRERYERKERHLQNRTQYRRGRIHDQQAPETGSCECPSTKWAVDRSIDRICRNRRIAGDNERKVRTSEHPMQVARIRLMPERFKRPTNTIIRAL